MAIRDLPFEEKIKLATHYRKHDIQPNDFVMVGFRGENNEFEYLNIDLYPWEARKRKLKWFKKYK